MNPTTSHSRVHRSGTQQHDPRQRGHIVGGAVAGAARDSQRLPGALSGGAARRLLREQVSQRQRQWHLQGRLPTQRLVALVLSPAYQLERCRVHGAGEHPGGASDLPGAGVAAVDVRVGGVQHLGAAMMRGAA